MDEGTLSDAGVPYEHHFKDAVWGAAGCFQCLELQQKKGMRAGKNPAADRALELECDGKSQKPSSPWWQMSEEEPQGMRLTLVSVPAGCPLGGTGASSNPSTFLLQSASPSRVIFKQPASAASDHLSLSPLFSPRAALPPPALSRALLPGKFFLLGSSAAASAGQVKGSSPKASCLY